MKPTRTWILVADGAQARIFLFEGRDSALKPLDEFSFEAPHPSNGEIMADRPGRSFDSTGPGRHAMEPHTQPVRHNKSEFARTLAAFLDQQHTRKAFDQLVIVAPPVSLGDLRSSLSDKVRACVFSELDKELVHIPVNQLVGHLEQVLPGLSR